MQRVNLQQNLYTSLVSTQGLHHVITKLAVGWMHAVGDTMPRIIDSKLCSCHVRKSDSSKAECWFAKVTWTLHAIAGSSLMWIESPVFLVLGYQQSVLVHKKASGHHKEPPPIRLTTLLFFESALFWLVQSGTNFNEGPCEGSNLQSLDWRYNNWPQVHLLCVYQTSPHVTRSPRPSTNAFVHSVGLETSLSYNMYSYD